MSLNETINNINIRGSKPLKHNNNKGKKNEKKKKKLAHQINTKTVNV